MKKAVRRWHLRFFGAFTLENAIRSCVQSVYLGDNTVLCRAIGRYKFFVDARDNHCGNERVAPRSMPRITCSALARRALEAA